MLDQIPFSKLKKETKTNFHFKDLNKISFIDSVSPPSVFIGSKLRYPEMNIGILSPLQKEEDAWIYDAPKNWA